MYSVPYSIDEDFNFKKTLLFKNFSFSFSCFLFSVAATYVRTVTFWYYVLYYILYILIYYIFLISAAGGSVQCTVDAAAIQASNDMWTCEAEDAWRTVFFFSRGLTHPAP